MAKKRTIAEWKGKIAGHWQWALKAAIRIVELQTPEEQAYSATLESNGVGLNAFDAELVTSIVMQFKERKRITTKQMGILQARMPKYASQLYGLTHDQSNRPSR